MKVKNYSEYEHAEKYSVGSGTASAEDIRRIEISWVTGSVHVELYDKDVISFSEVSSLDRKKDSIGEATENKELSESLRMRYRTEDGVLSIQFCKSGLRVRDAAVKDLKKDLTVYVPAGASFGSVTVDSVSSDVYVSGVSAGDIKIDGVSAAIKLVNCGSAAISCSTVSGTVDVVSGANIESLSVSSVSGSISVDAPSLSALSASCVSANVSLRLEDTDLTVRMTGAVSHLYANGLEYEKTENDTYKFGTGKGSVSIDSVSGSVSLEAK
ncbi:MAG: DUF4097 family beta strand repeat protein [Clostridia bacterium]|nr:DUF4097 family beta strand repeat protein [Clostridia bacterium]